MTTPITPKNLDHLVLRTNKLQEVIRFYEDVLGCKVERTIDTIGLYQLRAGASLIDIVDTDGELGKRGGPPPGAAVRAACRPWAAMIRAKGQPTFRVTSR